MAFGQSFDGLKTGEVHPWLRAVFGSIKFVFLASELRRLPSWITKLGLALMSNQIKQQFGKIRLFGAEAVKQRESMGTDIPDLLSNLLKQKEQGNISDGEIRETAAAFIVAGSETTATLLSASLYLLCRNPTILQKTVEMIRSDFSSVSDLTYSKLQSHEYLNAVLLESLRLYPPAPDSLFRRTKSAAVVVGEVIPADTCLTVNLWAANRSSKNFHRPDDFIPERWLKDTSPEFFDDDRAVAKPFSFGPRDCLGKV